MNYYINFNENSCEIKHAKKAIYISDSHFCQNFGIMGSLRGGIPLRLFLRNILIKILPMLFIDIIGHTQHPTPNTMNE